MSIDLPLGPDETPRTLQVKVVHAQAQGSGRWSLGCAFDKTLGEEDLISIQVKQPATTADEKRAWIRFSCEGERPAHATLLINPSHKIEARVLNISPGGVGLAEALFAATKPWASAALQLLSSCPCEDGCPACLLSARCEANNEMLDKAGAKRLLHDLSS